MTFQHSFLIQIISASTSFLASLVIMIMIKRATLTTPYRRLIFGLSAADVIHSVGMITGPYASPKGLSTCPWAVGNTGTCVANGLFNAGGSIGVALYLLSLSLYFFLKLNKRMADTDFSRLFEKKMHFLIIAFVFSFNLTALLSDSFNPIPTGAVCHVARYPTGCGVYPEIVGECTRGANHTMVLVYLLNVGVLPFCSLGISVCMVLLIRSAVLSERMYTLDNDGPVSRRSRARNFFNCIFCWYFEQNQRDNESDANYVLRLYRRETVTQASLYIGFFLISNIISLIVTMLNLAGVYDMPIAFKYIASFLYPLMGFFNILIYCRPKVQKFRFEHPEMSWILSFFLVVKAGVEVPDESVDPHALTVRCCCFPMEKPNHTELSNESYEPESSSYGVFPFYY
mmetsp:Transcript_18068/g.27075  ORF Transcript_18068/g.27075 Transcript_18068/m.27075 type:complete len:399 (+) Transcript_18068:120-1316(+)